MKTIKGSKSLAAFSVVFGFLGAFSAALVQAQALRIDVRYNYLDGSYLDAHAVVPESYVFASGWNNQSTGLNFSWMQGVAHDATLNVSYDLAQSPSGFTLFNGGDVRFGDYGDRVEFYFLDSVSFDTTAWLKWSQFSVDFARVTGVPAGIRSTPGYIGNGSNLSVTPVPLPASIFLFGSGFLGLLSLSKRNCVDEKAE